MKVSLANDADQSQYTAIEIVVVLDEGVERDRQLRKDASALREDITASCCRGHRRLTIGLGDGPLDLEGTRLTPCCGINNEKHTLGSGCFVRERFGCGVRVIPAGH